MIENKCREGLPECKARCCKIFGFRIPKGQISPELRYYYSIHKRVLVKSQGDRDVIIVATPCRYLDENLNCRVFGTKKQPVSCLKGYNIIKRKAIFVPGCIYPPNKHSLVLSEEDMRKLFGDK